VRSSRCASRTRTGRWPEFREAGISNDACVMWRVVVAIFLVGLASACSADKGFGNTEAVSADDYGAAWPLTTATAKVTCSENGQLSVTADGTTYELDADRSDVKRPHDTLDVVRAADSSTPVGYKASRRSSSSADAV
jgi:hypothetical protein